MTLNIVDLPTRAEVPRDGRGKPLVVPSTGGKPKALVRTTTYVDALDDKTNLMDWKCRGLLISAAKFPDVALESLKLDPEDREGKQELNKLVERLFSMGGGNDKREKGTELHALSELVDQGIPLPANLNPVDATDMAAYMMGTVSLTMHKIEQFVVIEEAGAAGTLDRNAEYAGPGPDGEYIEGNFIADLKTGRIDYGGLKIAAQLAAYSRGKVYDFSRFPAPHPSDKKAWAAWKKTEFSAEEAAAAYSPLSPAVNQDWGIIINLRPGSGEATLHWADLRVGWRAVEIAGIIREMRTLSSKALTPFA